MISSRKFIQHVMRGRDVCVRRSGAQRIIRFSDRRGKSCGEFTIALEDYDRLMLDVAEGLVGGHGKKFNVSIKRNYYGGICAEVRSGFISQACRDWRFLHVT